jgi:glyoxylase I family protein
MYSFHHICLSISSRELAARGIVEKDIEITQGRTGPRYFFITDPDGILVEISQDDREL